MSATRTERAKTVPCCCIEDGQGERDHWCHHIWWICPKCGEDDNTADFPVTEGDWARCGGCGYEFQLEGCDPLGCRGMANHDDWCKDCKALWPR